MSKIELTIIIPVYNCDKYIKRCLDSIINRDTKNLEVILIDDGSTDNSFRICQEYEQIHSCIKLFSKNNGGVSSARNYGLERAQGDYIFFIDSDDFLSLDFDLIIKECVNLNLPFVFFKRYYFVRDAEEYDYRKILPLMDKISNKIFFVNFPEKILMHKIFCSGSGEILVKKNLIGTYRFDEKRAIVEDYDFFFNIFAKKPDVFFYNDVLTIVNDNTPNSLTNRCIAFPFKSYLSSYNKFLLLHPKLKKKVYWIENYFDIKRLMSKDRIKHFLHYFRNHIKYFQINKYLAGYIFYVFGLDINRIRNTIKSKLK